ncbi:MAG: NAD(P)-dependent oxidoreductase [Pirellulales bacterium]|nr:NAD(P)-dependent oxidoreductase [Pirellulales bacterium]
MRAFITGISGFAGGHLAEHLLACGDEVWGSSRSGDWPAEFLAGVTSRARLLAWDLARADGLTAAAQQALAEFAPQVIYHLAAISVPSQCGQAEPTETAWVTNVAGTQQVVQLAAALPGRPRLLFVSTSHVYRPRDSAADGPFTESWPTEPRNAYGKTKLAAEAQVRAAIEGQGLTAVIIRAFQHTGPRQGREMMLVQWAWQLAAPSGAAVEVINRDTWIDLSDVRDVVRAYRLLAERGQPGETYNVGSGRAVRTGDVLALVEQVAGRRRPIVELRPGAKYDPVANIDRLQAATGWTPRISLEQTVADTWEDCRARAALAK